MGADSKTLLQLTQDGRQAHQECEHHFQKSSYSALRRISCEYRDGVLILEGRAPSHFVKQLAQTIGSKVDGVTTIDNRIVVQRPGGSRSR